MNDFTLERNAFGQLVFGAPGEDQSQVGVVPVRAFPIAAPDDGIAIVSSDGRELAWIEQLSDLPEPVRILLEQELASREFLPQILKIRHVSAFATPSTWQVDTDRGATSFVLKGEEDIRRIGPDGLIVADNHGVQYLVRDLRALDHGSRKLLDRFL
ncbi:MAG: DUF1854 domain-containing protein [Oxalobacteraceae bacterium]|nr:DUF1854 domain-containing protein [Oxalobacteraceae bacterium]